MTTREARRIRDALIRATHPGTYLASEDPSTVALMRKAALAIAWLERKAEKAEKRAKRPWQQVAKLPGWRGNYREPTPEGSRPVKDLTPIKDAIRKVLATKGDVDDLTLGLGVMAEVAQDFTSADMGRACAEMVRDGEIAEDGILWRKAAVQPTPDGATGARHESGARDCNDGREGDA